MKDCKTCGGDGAIPLYVGAKPCPCLTDRIERYRKALKTIAGPTYGTELCNTDAENNEILAGHFWRMQEIAKAALEDT